MHIYRGTQPYLAYPRVMGHELSGEVVERRRPAPWSRARAVYVMPYMSCGRTCAACRKAKPNCCMNIQVLGVHRDGGMAEYLGRSRKLRAQGAGRHPGRGGDGRVPGDRRPCREPGAVQPGQSVLVVGAGPIGIAAALFSKLRGGVVTALDSRLDRLDFCRDHLAVDHCRVQLDDSSRQAVET